MKGATKVRSDGSICSGWQLSPASTCASYIHDNHNEDSYFCLFVLVDLGLLKAYYIMLRIYKQVCSVAPGLICKHIWILYANLS